MFFVQCFTFLHCGSCFSLRKAFIRPPFCFQKVRTSTQIFLHLSAILDFACSDTFFLSCLTTLRGLSDKQVFALRRTALVHNLWNVRFHDPVLKDQMLGPKQSPKLNFHFEVKFAEVDCKHFAGGGAPLTEAPELALKGVGFSCPGRPET